MSQIQQALSHTMTNIFLPTTWFSGHCYLMRDRESNAFAVGAFGISNKTLLSLQSGVATFNWSSSLYLVILAEWSNMSWLACRVKQTGGEQCST